MRPVLIAGPTASGKSALALAIAERDGGVVINADALQVYDCWRVLTSRPDDADCARAPHRLYGHVAGDATYSVGAWLREIAPVITEVRTRGRRLVIVGGTGLYFHSLTNGLAHVPAIPLEVRARSDETLRAGRLDALIGDLVRDDPATLSRIDVANPRRVQRAWEVLVATGRGLHDWRCSGTTAILARENCVRLIVAKEIYYNNIDIKHRFEKMIEQGVIDECARFVAAGHDRDAPAGRALGAAALIGHLEGRLALTDAVEAAVIATRRYAKRQRTWIRGHMADWTSVEPGVAALGRVPRD